VHIAGGTVSISDSVLTSNTAQGGDGGRGLSLEVNGVPMQAKGGDGGNGLGGALYVAGGTVSVLNSEVTQNAATGGAGGNGVRSLKGAPGQGFGGGFYIDPLAAVSVDTFTANHMRRNRASTTGTNIHGPYALIP
jgi:hypothetical protein